MPSPIATDGFRVNVIPQTNFVDPRLLAPRYGDLIPSFIQGVNATERLSQIQDDSAMTALKLAQARQNLALAPLQLQLEQARIDEARQNAAVPRFVPQNITLEDQTKSYPAALDENGQPTGEPDRVLGDLVQVEQGVEYGPGGVATPVTRRKTLKSAADRALEEQRVTDLSNYRTGLNQINMLKAEAAKAKLDNPNYQKLGATVNEAGNVVYTLRNTKTGAVEQVDSGNAPIPTGMEALVGALGRAVPGASVTAPNTLPVVKAGGGTITPIGPDTEALIQEAARAKTGGDQIKTLTVDEARIAPVGTIFIGIDGKKRQKNANGTVSIIE